MGARVSNRVTELARWGGRGAAIALLVVTFGYRPLAAQAPDDEGREPPAEEEKPEAKRRFKVLASRASQVRPWLLKNEQRTELEGHDEPLFRLVDPTRGYPDGAIWAWPRKGRPAVVLTLSIMGDTRPNCLYEFVSFSEHPVGTSSTIVPWSCKQPGWEPTVLTDAPTPAASDRERLRQMRALARRFSAVELLPPPTEYELRLLPQPLLRYSDPKANQLDGAIFTFCHGTNPEVLLVIEARQEREKSPYWQFGFARNTIAELRVDLDGKRVWTQPHIRFADAGPSDSFFLAIESFSSGELQEVQP